MPWASEEQRDTPSLARRDDAGGINPGPLACVGLLVGRRFCELQDLHRRVVVVEQLALRRLARQLLVDRRERPRRLLDDVPLGGGGQRDAEASLQLLEA